MNERFFLLPREKQERIINAGYHVFANNTYKNSPVGEIAMIAGISKSLLFHYFHNKKELYLFLWDTCEKTTKEYLEAYDCYATTELFEGIERGMRAKFSLMRHYPDMAAFAIRAFYEKDSEVCGLVGERYQKALNGKAANVKAMYDTGQFIPGLNISQMYRNMYLATEGYLWEQLRNPMPDVNRWEKDFTEMVSFWKSIYLRRSSDVADEQRPSATL